MPPIMEPLALGTRIDFFVLTVLKRIILKLSLIHIHPKPMPSVSVFGSASLLKEPWRAAAHTDPLAHPGAGLPWQAMQTEKARVEGEL